MGKKLRRSTVEKTENNDIKCICLLFCCSVPRHQDCPSVPSPWWQMRKFPLCWTVLSSARCVLRWLIFVSQLSTWIYVFIYEISMQSCCADCLNSILVEEKIKAADFEVWLWSKPVVYFIVGQCVWPWITLKSFLFFEVCK